MNNTSRNPDNKEEDFSKFKEDKDMAEVINRLRKDKLTSEEFKYVSDIHSYDIYLARIQQENEENLARKLANQKKRLEKIVFQERQKAEQEKQKAEQETKLLQIKFVKMFLQQGETIPKIAETLELSIEKIEELIGFIEKNKI